MNKNISNPDRIIRALIAVVLAVLVTRELFGYSFATWRFHLRGETRWSAPTSQDKTFLLGIEIDAGEDGSRDLSAWRKLFT